MGFVDTMAKLPLPNLKKHKFNLPSVNCTTQDFFMLKPVLSREVVANEDIKIDMSAFSRLAPMVKPAYARCNMVNRAFFVPYRVVFPEWNEFITESENQYGQIPSSVPYIEDKVLRNFFFRLNASNITKYVIDAYTLDEVKTGSPVGTGNITVSDYHSLKSDFVVYGPCDQDLKDWDSRFGGGSTHWFQTADNKVWFPYAKYNLSPLGRKVYDILVNLGYNIDKSYFINGVVQFDSRDNPSIGNISDTAISLGCRYSALPLLSMLKVWFDWYSNRNLSIFEIDGQNVQEFFHLGSSYHFEWADLDKVFSWLTIYSYPKDYFNLATRDAFFNGQGSELAEHFIPDISITDDFAANQVRDDMTGTPVIQPVEDNSISNISQFMVSALRRLTDYMLRNNIVGGRVLDRMLSQYGVRLDADKLKRSVYLGKYTQPLTIMDVTQTSPTEVDGNLRPLGDYAGKGISQGNGHFELSSNNEFGQLIILSSIIPEVAYYQGVKREMRHMEKGDFYWPEFDSLGMQLMRSDEVCNCANQASNYASQHLYNLYNSSNSRNRNQSFGFVPRYAEYKQSDNQDILSGDFRLPSSAGTLMYYNTFRDLYPYLFDGTYFENSTNFSTATDYDQYDRIFADTSALVDHFITFFSFNVVSYKPMLPLYDSFDFGDDNEHNRKVNVSVAGTRFD